MTHYDVHLKDILKGYPYSDSTFMNHSVTVHLNHKTINEVLLLFNK